jgi:D-inositol-3-phosphate glycosyltransferase
MKIGMVSMQADPLAETAEPSAGMDTGEQGRHVADLAVALCRIGHDVRIYSGRQGNGPGPGRTVAGRAAAIEYGPDGDVREFGAWLRDRWHTGWRPDVVHTHFWSSGLAAVPAAAEHGVPVVHTYHSLGSVRRRWYGRADPGSRGRVRAERALGSTVDRVVALCNTEVNELARLGLTRASVRVVPSGVDTEVFTPKGEAAPAEPGRQRVLTVGWLSPDSGLEDMVKALHWVPLAELVIAGGPAPDRLDADPRVGRLRRLAASLGLTDRVRFLGAVPADNLPRWYRSADVYASTSADGTFGLPAVEAMACGAPVVAYGVGGFLESVVHRVTGVLVQPHDIRAFALALRGLLRNDIDRLAYGDAGVDRAQSRYDWRRVAGDLARIYEEVRA